MTRIFLLDDHEVVRQGLRAILDDQDDLEVVGEAADIASAISSIRCCGPDLAVLDLHLLDGTGIELCERIVGDANGIRCIILASSIDDLELIAAHRAGAAAFLTKDTAVDDLVQAIRAVATGRRLLDDARVRLAKRRLRNTEAGQVDALTPREGEILRYIQHGRTNREIAEMMSISDTTVKNYVSNLLAKLGVTRRAQAAAIAGRLEAHAFAHSR